MRDSLTRYRHGAAGPRRQPVANPMRAGSRDPEDDAAGERLRCALRSLAADLPQKSWGLGVTVYRLNIGGDELTIFSDAWSIDVEGPDALVRGC